MHHIPSLPFQEATCSLLFVCAVDGVGVAGENPEVWGLEASRGALGGGLGRGRAWLAPPAGGQPGWTAQSGTRPWGWVFCLLRAVSLVCRMFGVSGWLPLHHARPSW